MFFFKFDVSKGLTVAFVTKEGGKNNQMRLPQKMLNELLLLW
jgi:hypothetical protein